MCEKTQGTIIMTLHDVDPTNRKPGQEPDGEGAQRYDNLAGTTAPERPTSAPDVYQIPKSKEGRKWAVRAGAGALTLALAAGGFLGVKAMGGGEKGPAPSQPGASAPAVPGQTEQPTTSASEVPKTSRNPEGLSAENYGYQFKGETLTKAEFVKRLQPSVEQFPNPRDALKYMVETSFTVCADGGGTPGDLKHKSYNPDNNAGPGPDALQRDMYNPACMEALFENTNLQFAAGMEPFDRNEARLKGITNNEYKGAWEFGGVVTASTNADGPVQMHSVAYYNNNFAETRPQILVDEGLDIPAHSTVANAFTLDKKDGHWIITDVADSPIAKNSELAQKYDN
jgi:hypothetical protein